MASLARTCLCELEEGEGEGEGEREGEGEGEGERGTGVFFPDKLTCTVCTVHEGSAHLMCICAQYITCTTKAGQCVFRKPLRLL